MKNLRDMLHDEEYNKIWDTYLGFLDLDIKEFMTIQKRLLLEQIELLNDSELGRKIFNNQSIKSIEDFRKKVPLTTYDDYADILLNKQNEALPSEPLHWVQTTWKGGDKPIKLAPYSKTMVEENTKMFLSSLILSTSKSRGHFTLRNHDKFLYGMAPRPYLTGYAPYILKNEIDFDYLPDTERAEQLSFKERNVEGFKLAIKHGADLFYGVSSVLVKIGESFANDSGKSGMIWPANVKQAIKLIKALYKKKIKKKPLLPKDLFEFKGIVCGGTDSATYKERIEHLFGITPLEIFGGTESAAVATETWSRNGMTFFPDVNFLEFIPEKEIKKEENTPGYKPSTVLLDEIKPNEVYELVITKLRGGAFVRYRIGDIMKCVGLKNKEDGVNLPQVIYLDRVHNIIDLAGFTRLTKQVIGDAIKLSQLDILHYIANKEYINNKPIIHLYLEVKGVVSDKLIKEKINHELKQLDSDYQDVHEMLGYDPLKITRLKNNSFASFKEQKGYYPKIMNPEKETIEAML
ncbi:MAG: GH3 auxin-responsive promoter family protein [Candidatus Izemoplasma sp.]|nr:GH3 auxin-responsive promoter family protein [Candidatus Izemoplasma sp.]